MVIRSLFFRVILALSLPGMLLASQNNPQGAKDQEDGLTLLAQLAASGFTPLANITLDYAPEAAQSLAADLPTQPLQFLNIQNRNSAYYPGQSVGQLVDWSPCGNYVVAASRNNLNIYDVHNGSLIQTLIAHRTNVVSVAWSNSDPNIIRSTSNAGGLRTWNIETGHNSHFVIANHFPYQMVLQKNAPMVGFCGDLGSLSITRPFLGHGESTRTDTHLTPVADGRFSVLAWSHHPQLQLAAANPQRKKIVVYHDDATIAYTKYISHPVHDITALAWSPDNRQIAYAYFLASYPNVYDVIVGDHTLSGHTDSINYIEYSPNGKFLASASDDMTVKIWDVQTGQLLYTLAEFAGPIRTVRWSPDGSRLACESYGQTPDEGRVSIWQSPVSKQDVLDACTQATNKNQPKASDMTSRQQPQMQAHVLPNSSNNAHPQHGKRAAAAQAAAMQARNVQQPHVTLPKIVQTNKQKPQKPVVMPSKQAVRAVQHPVIQSKPVQQKPVVAHSTSPRLRRTRAVPNKPVRVAKSVRPQTKKVAPRLVRKPARRIPVRKPIIRKAAVKRPQRVVRVKRVLRSMPIKKVINKRTRPAVQRITKNRLTQRRTTAQRLVRMRALRSKRG